MQYHTEEVEKVAQEFSTSLDTGLASSEIPTRLERYGSNQLEGKEGSAWIKILLRQFIDPMNWVFIGLGVGGFVLKDWPTGSVLVTIAFINLYLTFSQEYAAERTLAALRKLSSPLATVIRDGVEQQIPSVDVVPGDVVVINDGDSVPADCRLFFVSNLETDEALLTGESMPVSKATARLQKDDEALGDRFNMAYSSTVVTRGRGMGIAVATGMETQIGKVAIKVMNDPKSGSTHIQKALFKMYIFLLGVAVTGLIIVMAVAKFKVDEAVGLYALSAALSVLPAGLTTVLTLTLVLGGKEMARHRAVVRKLKSLETLGSVTHIFSDKTGTLTMAKMVLTNVWIPTIGHFYVEGNGIAPEGRVFMTGNDAVESVVEAEGKSVVALQSMPTELSTFTTCAALCNVAAIAEVPVEVTDKNDKEESVLWATSGSPSEVAIQVFAHKLKMGRPDLETLTPGKSRVWERSAEFPFDSRLKRMSVVYVCRQRGDLKGDEAIPVSAHVFTKGAIEMILDMCTQIDVKTRTDIMRIVKDLASRGLRVMGFATKEVSLSDLKNIDDLPSAAVRAWRDEIEKDLNFLGLCSIYDPPRPESQRAVKEAHQAGISVHMLTGDHRDTAIAIAHDIGILPARGSIPPERMAQLITTGPQLDALSIQELDALPALPLVVARCTPESKVKIIEASRRRNYISIMTGDGVNDSPSLRLADVGVAMGGGSDVAKAASDLVLSDDNFATIIVAIAEGRRIYVNIQRFLLYYWITLLSCFIIIVTNLWVTDPAGVTVAPLTPVIMIFGYAVMTPPAGSLSVQKAHKDNMRKPPRPPKESLFNSEILWDLFFYSLLMSVLCLSCYWGMIWIPYGETATGVAATGCDVEYSEYGCRHLFSARATLILMFSIAAFIQAIHCISFREAEFGSRFWTTVKNDKTWWISLLVTLAVFCVFDYIDVVAIDGFGMAAVNWVGWVLVIGSSIVFIAGGEAYKAYKRRFWKARQVNNNVEMEIYSTVLV